MRLLLDTQLLAWLASRRRKLKATERRAIEEHAGRLLVSGISIWELRLKWRSNPAKAAADLLITPQAAVDFCADREIPVLPFTLSEAVVELAPPLRHKDPFDDVLLVHARSAGAKLLTRDDDLLWHPLAYHP